MFRVKVFLIDGQDIEFQSYRMPVVLYEKPMNKDDGNNEFLRVGDEKTFIIIATIDFLYMVATRCD